MMYHITYYVKEIMKEGIKPSAMTGNTMFPGMKYDKDYVYFAPIDYINYIKPFFPGAQIIGVNVDGINYERDPGVGEPFKAYRYKGIISPHRIFYKSI